MALLSPQIWVVSIGGGPGLMLELFRSGMIIAKQAVDVAGCFEETPDERRQERWNMFA